VAAERIVTVVILAAPAVVAVGRAVLRAAEELRVKETLGVAVLLRLHLIFRLLLAVAVALVPLVEGPMRTGILHSEVRVALVLHHP
jgi:hypothetical protein